MVYLLIIAFIFTVGWDDIIEWRIIASMVSSAFIMTILLSIWFHHITRRSGSLPVIGQRSIALIALADDTPYDVVR